MTATMTTVAVLPVRPQGVVAPETILCALGYQGRRAMQGERNCVVCLPVLDVQAHLGDGGEECSP